MKKIVSLMMATLMLFAVVACFFGCGDSKDTFVIGCTGPLTGGAAVYGTAVKNAAQLAVDEINAAGGLDGKLFSFVMVDDELDSGKASTNYASLMSSGMQVSLGSVTTGVGNEINKLTSEDNVFFITPSATGDDIPKYANGYQMCFNDGVQGEAAAKYINETCAGQTIGVFYRSDDDYSIGLYNNFKKFLSDDVKTVEASFVGAPDDFSSQIDTLKNCSFIFMPVYYQPASQFMEQAKNIVAPNTVYYGCDGFDGIDGIEGWDINSIPQEVSMLSHFDSKATSGAAKEFIDKYVNKYGSETLNQFGAAAYDCVYAIYNAMKEISETTEISTDISASDLCDLLKAKFQGGFTYSGATGTSMTWNEGGYVQKDAIKYIIKAATK